MDQPKYQKNDPRKTFHFCCQKEINNKCRRKEFHYHQCPFCQQLWPDCPDCRRPLLARYDLDAVHRTLRREDLLDREKTLWRYREVLPVRDDRYVLTLGEGFTPLHNASRLAAAAGFEHLFIKDEGGNPSGSFKARGMSVAVSRAVELGARSFSIPTAGNAGCALAAAAALSYILFAPKPDLHLGSHGVPDVAWSDAGAMLGALLLVALAVDVEAAVPVPWLFMGALGAAGIALGRGRADREVVPWTAAAATALVIVAWSAGSTITAMGPSHAIAVGSALSTSTASQGIASRLISEPNVETTSAAKTRRKPPECANPIVSGLRRRKADRATPDYLGGNGLREWRVTVERSLVSL
mgnify:CR=1 FL=1